MPCRRCLALPALLIAFLPALAATADDAPGRLDEAKPLLCERGKQLLSEDFPGAALGEGWRAAKGDWTVKDGVLKGVEKPDDQHAAVVRHELKAHDLIARFSFRFDGGKSVGLSINGSKGHVCRLRVTPALIAIQKDKPSKNSDEKPAVLDTLKVEIKPGEWHTAVVEVCGKDMVASVDGKHVLFGSDSGVDVDKANFGFPVAGEGVSLKEVRVWEALAPKDRDEALKKLEGLRQKPAATPATP